MDARVRRVPLELTEKIFSDPTASDISALAKNLTKGLSDTSAKVKVLHDWICDNISYDTDFFTVGVGEQDPISVLKRRAAICVGYANLMYVLCYFVGIEAPPIAGWSKGFRYPGYLREQSDHAWNAVKIGSRWQLIDVTWDAGYVDYKTFIKHYSTEYLYLTAEQFVYSHLPEDEEKQFLPKQKIRSHEDFEREPYLPGRFFSYGFSLVKNSPNYANKIEGESTFEFGLSKQNVLLSAELSGKSRAVPNYTWVERSGKSFSVTLDVPDGEKYTARIYAKNMGNLRILDYIPISVFENRVLPAASALLSEKKITQSEFDYLEPSYFKVEENGFYYYKEDVFDTKRNAAVLKIFKLTEENTNALEEVVHFDVQASDEYAGTQNEPNRFPEAYRTFNESNNIRLVFPKNGSVVRGETVDFSIVCAPFSSVGIVVDGELTLMQKNVKTGRFELSFTIPQNAQRVAIYASKNKTDYAGLLEYAVVDPKPE